MNKIESINLERLRNNEHAQFMADAKKCMLSKVPSDLGITDEFTEFSNLLDLENMVLIVENGSQKSKTVEQMDKLRDKTWSAINFKIRAHLNSPFTEEETSAETVKYIFDQYGDIRSLPYNEESSAMDKLLNELLADKMAVHLQKTEIKLWVAELKKQNDLFQATFNERNSEWANKLETDTKTARLQVDAKYAEIIGKVNASFTLKVAKDCTTSFAKEMNELIAYYKTTLSARTSRNNKAEKSKSTDTPTA
jgi:hypothetical protein